MWARYPCKQSPSVPPGGACPARLLLLLLFYSRTGPRRALSLRLSDTRVYEPEKRTRLGRNRELCTLLSCTCRICSTAVGGKPGTWKPWTLNPGNPRFCFPTHAIPQPLPCTLRLTHDPQNLDPDSPKAETFNPESHCPPSEPLDLVLNRDAWNFARQR